MVSGTVQDSGAQAADQTTQHELLGRLSATHRRAVADALDLPPGASAQQIAATFDDESLLQVLLNDLSGRAYEFLARAAFDAEGIAVTLGPLGLDPYFSFEHERIAAASELERHGLAFPFLDHGEVVYHVPANLHAPLRRAFAVRFARSVTHSTAQRWLAAPRQDLQDIAALWALLARTPVPITRDGQIYKRSKRRLLAALPRLELPKHDGALTQRRLTLALAQLRDSGHLRMRFDEHDPYPSKGELVAAGDLPSALTNGAAFEHFPGDHEYKYLGCVVCARALGKALTGRDVGIVSFGRRVRSLIDASERSAPREWTPSTVALAGLLPGWLRGELQLGLSGGRLVAIRFAPAQHPTDEWTTKRTIAERCRKIRPLVSVDDEPGANGNLDSGEQKDQSLVFSRGSRARSLWDPQEPYQLYRRWDAMFDPTESRVIPISTLDTPLDEDLFCPIRVTLGPSR